MPAEPIKTTSNPSLSVPLQKPKQQPQQQSLPQPQIHSLDPPPKEKARLMALEAEFMDSNKPFAEYSDADKMDIRRGSLLRLYGTLNVYPRDSDHWKRSFDPETGEIYYDTTAKSRYPEGWYDCQHVSSMSSGRIPLENTT
ncbi:MAG: hypothetical protein M1829_000188 [Trizodia sp. TS-e1964]|nr:MAG: hypothetical protein M1829_000188 [Trizodia sp. TS-e1964]